MKRVFCFLLVLLLVAGLVPMQAFAQNADGSPAAPASVSHTVTVTYYEDYGCGFTCTSNNLTQTVEAGSAIDPVVFQTDADHVFPSNFMSGTASSGISVERISASEVRVTGTPTADAAITMGYASYLYRISLLDGDIDKVTLNKTRAAAGETITITPKANYKIVELVACGSDDTNNLVSLPDTSFTMPESKVDISVRVENVDDSNIGGNEGGNGGGSTPQPAEYNITVTNPENGEVKTDVSKAKKDDTVTVTATPSDGYELDEITVTCNGAPVEVDNNNQFVMPEGEVTVTVTFKAKQQDPQNPPAPTEYNITVTNPENGTVSEIPAKAKKDDVITVTAAPADGYELDEITVTCNGAPVEVDNNNQFVMPEGDVTVTVTFKAKQTLPSGLSFSYAYDVQRSPTYPKKGGSFTVSGFDYPYGPSGSQLDSNEGPWVLSPVGKYSSNKNLSGNLTGIVNGIAGEYGVPAGDLPIHKLIRCNNGQETTIAYGVLIMHNSSKQVAFFIGDSLSGSGAGYFFSKNVQSGTQNYDVPKDVTDQVKPSNKIQITFDPNNGGATSDSKLDPGDKLNEVPSANRDDHVFTGWFTADGTPVTENTVFTEDTTVYARWAAHTTDPDNNAFRANINMTNQAVVDMLVTQNDMMQGQDVRVFMNVERMNTENVPSSDKTAIIDMAGSKRVAAFVDIQLLKQIGTATPTPIHNTQTNMVPITMKLDDAVIPSGAGKDTFTIIYHHVEDGTATTDEISATFDAASKTLTFQANKFSTYALVVKNKAPTGTLDKVVKSGDISGFNGMSMLLLCCAVVLAGVAVYDKKRTK